MVVVLGVPSSGGPLRAVLLDDFLPSPLASASSETPPSAVFFASRRRRGFAVDSDASSGEAFPASACSSFVVSRVRRGVPYSVVSNRWSRCRGRYVHTPRSDLRVLDTFARVFARTFLVSPLAASPCSPFSEG